MPAAKMQQVTAALYLSMVTIILAALSRANVTEKDPWLIGDWLINYQGGFVRRGLPGELAYKLGRHMHLSAIPITVAMQLTMYGVLLLAVWRLVNLSSWALWIRAFLFSPATLAFPFLDSYGGFRKEIILLAGLGMLVRMLHSTGRSEETVSLYLVTTTAVLALSHEALLLFLPYWFAAVAIWSQSLRKAAKLMLPAGVVGLGCWVAALTHPGNAGVAQHICGSLGVDAEGYCSGAVASLAQNKLFAHDQVLQMITVFHPVWMYAGLGLLGMLPGLFALMSLWRSKEKRWEFRVIACAILVSMALTSVLFLYALDWGRWIYIHVFSLFLVLLFVDVRTQAEVDVDRQSRLEVPMANNSRWCLAMLLVYATTWSVPRMPRSLPPTGYFSIPASRTLYAHYLEDAHRWPGHLQK